MPGAVRGIHHTELRLGKYSMGAKEAEEPEAGRFLVKAVERGMEIT